MSVSNPKNNQFARSLPKKCDKFFSPELKDEKLILEEGSRQSSGFHVNPAFDLSCTLVQTRTHTHTLAHTQTQTGTHTRTRTRTHTRTHTLASQLSCRSVLQINVCKLSKRVFFKSQVIVTSRISYKRTKKLTYQDKKR